MVLLSVPNSASNPPNSFYITIQPYVHLKLNQISLQKEHIQTLIFGVETASKTTATTKHPASKQPAYLFQNNWPGQQRPQ